MEPIYDISDLCRLTGESPRTVHFYIRSGLLAAAGTAGRGPRYDDGHVARLRLVRRLQREHLPLGEIRQRLAGLTDDEAIALASRGAIDASVMAGESVAVSVDAPELGASPESGEGDASRAPGPSVATGPFAGGRTLRSRATAPGAAGDGSAEKPASSALDYVREVLARETRAPSTADLLRPRGRSSGSGDAESPSSESSGRADRADLRSSITATPAPPQAATSDSFPRERSQWERITLAPDVELHIRRPQSRDVNRRIERLLDAARGLFGEE